MIREHNLLTGEIIDREMTAEELAQLEINQSVETARQEAEAVKVAAKQAVLDRLGLTAEEAAALLS